MKDNVRIEVRERGKLVTVREGHNIFTEYGRSWLASLVSYTQFDPDVAERNDRIRYMGVGVGSKEQSSSLAGIAPITTLYPAGYDPHTTSGNEYNDDFPVIPLIGTLERPVKLSGSTSDAYDTAPSTDVWLIDTPNFFITHMSTTDTTYHGSLSGSDLMLSGFFTAVPISEVALVTDSVAVSKNQAYNPAVGYFSFDTIHKTADITIDFAWSVRF